MAQIGNKQNAALNGEWGSHVRKRDGGKKVTSRKRRTQQRAQIRELANELDYKVVRNGN